MIILVAQEELIRFGLDQAKAASFLTAVNTVIASCKTPEESWITLIHSLLTKQFSFDLHLFIFENLFPNWREHPETAPAWAPTNALINSANISAFMADLDLHTVASLHQYSIQHSQDFWQRIIAKLGIIFKKPPDLLCSLKDGVTSPEWFPGAKMNIVDSCFNADKTATALIYEDANKNLYRLSYEELNHLTNQIACSLTHHGYHAGDAIAIAMPMGVYAIAIYLGIIKMGGVVVGIADSFSAEEIATRLQIANARLIFTQDLTIWNNKKIPLYKKIAPISIDIIMLALDPKYPEIIAERIYRTWYWDDFIIQNNHFTSVACYPMDACNILFSSGTTGHPKAIVWNHTTAIKVASDAYFHQNIQAGDVLAWPTNLGWMMGPWLIFAALINKASIAVYPAVAKDHAFGEFVQRAKVTMLGVVPTLVAIWRESKCMEHLDWRAIKTFSSSAECSNPENMLYLMYLAQYKPVIEYCGGTEIGGAYLSSTVIEKNYPSLFSTPTMGLQITILEDDGDQTNVGEVAISPPSIGLSTNLLNANHEEIYYANMPLNNNGIPLRRHGDQIKQYANGYYAVLGRADDTMKLGGIKVSAAEIERTLAEVPHLIEVAAIAVQPRDNGPSQLIIYATVNINAEQIDKKNIIQAMQQAINLHLNPLFKIHEVILVNELPKTASNKIMRRILRMEYENKLLN